jgi:hypothetical protein
VGLAEAWRWGNAMCIRGQICLGGGGGEVDDEQTMTVIMAPTVVVVVHGLLALIEYIHILLLYIYIFMCVRERVCLSVCLSMLYVMYRYTNEYTHTHTHTGGRCRGRPSCTSAAGLIVFYFTCMFLHLRSASDSHPLFIIIIF